MGSNEKTSILNIPQGVMNIPKVSGSEETLTHMMMANQNVKPYVDTITDMMYNYPDVPKARLMNPMYVTGMNGIRTNPNPMEDCK